MAARSHNRRAPRVAELEAMLKALPTDDEIETRADGDAGNYLMLMRRDRPQKYEDLMHARAVPWPVVLTSKKSQSFRRVCTQRSPTWKCRMLPNLWRLQIRIAAVASVLM